MPLHPTSRPLPFAAALALTGLAGCLGQGEGQLCSPLAGNHGTDDCQSGLVCVVTLSRCCPQDRSTATTSVCSLNSGAFDANPAPPNASTEASAADEASTDVLVESASDGGAAGTSDAPGGADGSDATIVSDATTVSDATMTPDAARE